MWTHFPGSELLFGRSNTHMRSASISPWCFPGLSLFCLVALLISLAGCGPRTQWVRVSVNPDESRTQYVRNVRLEHEHGEAVPVIALRGARATYYDSKWQQQTISLGITPVLREKTRPNFLIAAILPPTLVGGALVIGGISGFVYWLSTISWSFGFYVI